MRIRQRIMGDHSDPRNDRLASIPQRNFPQPPVGIDPSALEGMSAVELYANRRNRYVSLDSGLRADVFALFVPVHPKTFGQFAVALVMLPGMSFSQRL